MNKRAIRKEKKKKKGMHKAASEKAVICRRWHLTYHMLVGWYRVLTNPKFPTKVEIEISAQAHTSRKDNNERKSII